MLTESKPRKLRIGTSKRVNMGDLGIIARARVHGPRTALADGGRTCTYDALLDESHRVATALLVGEHDLAGARVAFLTPPDTSYVSVQWGVWRAGGVAVPLAVMHPERELRYVIEDSDADVVIVDDAFANRILAGLADMRVLSLSEALSCEAGDLPVVVGERPAMILYTSGTSGSPKGVVTTHNNIEAQVTSLTTAWEWAETDVILNVLPLHHIHGVVNCVACALWAGATCEMMPRFDADAVWRRIGQGGITLLMGVPTIYHRLIGAWDSYTESRRAELSSAAARLRLMVSGSAALPVRTLEHWRRITGHTLLERYGLTETGMVLSNPLHGQRTAGTVGVPLPDCHAKLVDDDGAQPTDGATGEIHVQGPAVFKEYWRRPDATRDGFSDGWFRTGDVACMQDGVYRILGRSAIDIIKTGGYKISALEIENAFREHDSVSECAVVGVPDDDLGERVCLAVVCTEGRSPDPSILREWAKEVLAPYKVPRDVRVIDALPRNAMGKVLKSELARVFERSSHPAG